MRFDDFWSIWDTLSDDAKALAAKCIYGEVQILDDDADKMILGAIYKKFGWRE